MPTATANGTKLNYTDTGGSGTPVVLLHAFPFNSSMWAPQLESLGEKFRFIVPDLKGFGDSDAPDDRDTYTMDGYSDDVKALLDDLGIDRYVLAGLSMGGYIALAYMRKYADGVIGLVLADTKADADPPEGIEKRTNQQNIVSSDGTSGLIETLTGALLAEETRNTKPDVVKNAQAAMENPAAGFIGALEAMKKRIDSTESLAKISVPTLVIVGENDGVTPPDAARKLHEHIGGSQLVVIPGAGHISNMEAPEAFNGALGEFLNKL
jgi:3-oxoadipate enol-lactonase